MDYPRVRNSRTCVFCNHEKEAGLLACWYCYRSRDMRAGIRSGDSLMLDKAESRLAFDAMRQGTAQHALDTTTQRALDYWEIRTFRSATLQNRLREIPATSNEADLIRRELACRVGCAC